MKALSLLVAGLVLVWNVQADPLDLNLPPEQAEGAAEKALPPQAPSLGLAEPADASARTDKAEQPTAPDRPDGEPAAAPPSAGAAYHPLEEWDTGLHLRPDQSGRRNGNWLALRLSPPRGDERLDDEAAEIRSFDIGGVYVDGEMVHNVLRHGLRRTHDLGQDVILEVGLIQPRTARTSAGPSLTTIGMRLQLSPVWEVHAGYGAGFGSGMRAQVGLSLNW